MCKLNASTLTNSISREIRMGTAFPITTTMTIYSATPDSQVTTQMDLNASRQMVPSPCFHRNVHRAHCVQRFTDART